MNLEEARANIGRPAYWLAFYHKSGPTWSVSVMILDARINMGHVEYQIRPNATGDAGEPRWVRETTIELK